MRILALDPATKCGWAIEGVCGTFDLSIRRDESAGMRLVRLRAKMSELNIPGNPIRLVVFEAARNCAPKMQGALVVQAEFQSVIKLWCEDNRVEYRGYSPTEIKRHATGKGNANKDAMLTAAKKKWPGTSFADDNAADAMWLLDLAQKELVPA